MKRFIAMFAAMVFVLSITCYAELLPGEPKIVDATMHADGILLLDDAGNLYIWDQSSYTPYLHDTKVTSLDHYFSMAYYKGEPISQNRIKAKAEADEHFDVNDPETEHYVSKDKCLMYRGPNGDVEILQNIKTIRIKRAGYYISYDQSYYVLALCDNGNLYKVQKDHAELINTNVKWMESNFPTHLSPKHHIFVLYNNGVLEHEYEDFPNNLYEKITHEIFENIVEFQFKLGQLYLTDIKHDVKMISKDFLVSKPIPDEILTIAEKVEKAIVDARSSEYQRGILIYPDGSVWYWGQVICSKYITGGMHWNFEFQKDPQRLYWDEQKNIEISDNRIRSLLMNTHDSTKGELLEENAEFYLSKFPECFTKEEIEEYNFKKLREQKKNEHRSPQSSSISQHIEIATEPSPPMDEVPAKLNFSPIIGGALILSTVGILLYWFQKRKAI